MFVTRSRTKWFLLLVPALLIVAGYYMFFRESSQPEASQTIILSNGKKVYIGESVLLAKEELKDDFHKDTATDYHYPATIDTSHPLQVYFYVNKDHIVGIRVRNNSGNIHKETGVRIGMSVSEVKEKATNKLKPFDVKLIRGRAKGYLLQDSKSVTRYLINPCTSDNKVIVVEVLDLSYMDAYGIGAGCGNRY